MIWFERSTKEDKQVSGVSEPSLQSTNLGNGVPSFYLWDMIGCFLNDAIRTECQDFIESTRENFRKFFLVLSNCGKFFNSTVLLYGTIVGLRKRKTHVT